MADNNIHLVKDYLGLDPEDDPRSITGVVTASINGQVVTVSFSEPTASQIVVKDSSNMTVFNHTYTPEYSVQVNLSLLPSGYYAIYIYAIDSWWYGYFNL